MHVHNTHTYCIQVPILISDHPEPEGADVRKDTHPSSPVSESPNIASQELPLQSTSNCDNTTIEVPKKEIDPTPPGGSSDKQVDEFSPFIQTASYLLDVNMAKVWYSVVTLTYISSILTGTYTL